MRLGFSISITILVGVIFVSSSTVVEGAIRGVRSNKFGSNEDIIPGDKRRGLGLHLVASNPNDVQVSSSHAYGRVPQKMNDKSDDSGSDGSDLCEEKDMLYVEVTVRSDDKFSKSGSIKLEDSDGDDIWDEDDFDKNEFYRASKCLDLDDCYEFTAEAGDKAFKDGELKLFVDTGSGLKRKLYLDDEFDYESVEFGDDCD